MPTRFNPDKAFMLLASSDHTPNRDDALDQVQWAIEKASKDLRRSCNKLELSADQRSALVALKTWYEFLRCSSCQKNGYSNSNGKHAGATPDEMRHILKVMGYLPKNGRVVEDAISSMSGEAEKVFRHIARELCRENGAVKNFLKATSENIQKCYGALSVPQIELLQGFIDHQCKLDQLDTDNLVAQFPFPITKLNYFGRFLAGGCENPEMAQRFMKLAVPFFIRMKSLLEGLSYDQYRFLEISVRVRIGTDEDGEPEYGLEQTTAEEDNIIHYCINHVRDLVADQNRSVDRDLWCIEFPYLPDISIEHIEPSEYSQLVVELYDWLFLGKKDGELLQRRALSVGDEADYEFRKNELERVGKNIDTHAQKRPGYRAKPQKKEEWRSEQTRLQKKKEELEERIRQDESKRKKKNPIVRYLEKDEQLSETIEVFRKEVQTAVKAGKKIVFSLIGGSNQNSNLAQKTPFLTLLDRAFHIKEPSGSEGLCYLRKASFLLTTNIAGVISASALATPDSVKERQIRPFIFERRELNSGVRHVVARIMPEKPDPKIEVFSDKLVKSIALPGVTTVEHLKYLVRKKSSKENPTITDYLEYIFESSEQIEMGRLYEVLEVARSQGMSNLSPRCEAILLERMHYPEALTDNFRKYMSTYRPDTVGSVPEPFVSMTSFKRFNEAGLDCLGMLDETKELATLLERHGVVVVVDSTNYDSSAGISEEAAESWGSYVPPIERLVRSFALQLAKAEVPEGLQDLSLLTTKELEGLDLPFHAFVKNALGIDLTVAADLSRINEVLSKVAIYSKGTILVFNAESVKDIEQYREFIKQVENNGLKCIIRTREPIAGLASLFLKPFMAADIPGRLENEPELSKKLGIRESPSSELLKIAVERVDCNRLPSGDPLNLTLQVLSGASRVARMEGSLRIESQDLVAALAPIFHLPSPEQIFSRAEAIDRFVEVAPLEVLGQEEPIRELARRVKSHRFLLRDETRPLTMRIPGATGTGKTAIAVKLAQILNDPLFQVEGSQFTESHSAARLVGSPSGYVGPSKGILCEFIERNPYGMVFADEVEKFHEEVKKMMMNFFDTGTLTTGEGEIIRRPGLIILTASNAGADRLLPGMTTLEIQQVLVDAFQQEGAALPEFVARLDPVVMYPLTAGAFKKVLRKNLDGMGTKAGFISANLELQDVDDVAAQLLYEECKDLCDFHETYGKGAIGIQKKDSIEGELYNNLRQVSRALERLSGTSILEMVEAQYRAGGHRKRGVRQGVKFVGDLNSRRILLKTV